MHADPAAAGDDERVLVVPLTRHDGEVTVGLLERIGVRARTCVDLGELARELERGVGAIVLSEAALADPRVDELVAALRAQPAWSDVPIVMSIRDRDHSLGAIRVLDTLGNVTLLDRPTSTRSMISAVRAALGARRRQYQLRERMTEQQRVEQSLREAERRKDEFLAMLAHELRNPLAPLTNALRFVDRVEPLTDRGRDAVRMAVRQTGQLAHLVDDLLEVNRITRGTITLECEPLDVVVAVREAAEAVVEECAARRHELVLDLPAAPVRSLADPVRMAQILGNLLGNAIKYTPDGGRIRVRLREQEGSAEIRVTDNGIGIAQEKLGGLFQLFYQVDMTLDRSRGGLGIGLAMVKALVELHGGDVEAHSAGPGRGATFTVRLPLLPAESR